MRKKDEKLEKPEGPGSAQFHSRSANYKAEKETHVNKSYKENKNR